MKQEEKIIYEYLKTIKTKHPSFKIYFDANVNSLYYHIVAEYAKSVVVNVHINGRCANYLMRNEKMKNILGKKWIKK